jgi:hypothetical protein
LPPVPVTWRTAPPLAGCAIAGLGDIDSTIVLAAEAVSPAAPRPRMRSRREMPLLRYCLMSSFIVVLPQFRSGVGFFDVTLAHAFNGAH